MDNPDVLKDVIKGSALVVVAIAVYQQLDKMCVDLYFKIWYD